jgi:hypothetical protein
MTQEFQKQLENILHTAQNIFQIVATFLVAFLVVLWMTLCFWTFRDIQARTRDIIAQVFATLLVLFFNIPGVLLYILVRPKETLAQAYERSLQEEYMLQDLEEREICPTCRVKTQPDFQFCFNCRTRLRRECSNCGSMIKIKWANCPFCSTAQKPRTRETGIERAGLGMPRPHAPSAPPTPVGTALATMGNQPSNQGLDTYQTYTAPPSPRPSRQTAPLQPYADAGENYNTAHEQAYSYPTENRSYIPSSHTEQLEEDLANDIAPELSADGGDDTTFDQYKPPRQRRNRNGHNPRGQND